MLWGWIFAWIIGDRGSTKVAKIKVIHWHLTFLWQGQVCFLMHLYGKKHLKILFSKTEDGLWLNLCIYHLERAVYQSCWNNCHTLTFNLFTARSSLLLYAFVWAPYMYGKNVDNFKWLFLWSLRASVAQISCGAQGSGWLRNLGRSDFSLQTKQGEVL